MAFSNCAVVRSPSGLEQEVEWACHHRSGATFSVYELAFAAAIYHEWFQRNARIFEMCEGKWISLGFGRCRLKG